MCDTWRLTNPDVKDYTWRHKSKPIVRRLDYILCNNVCIEKISNCNIIDVCFTDHRGVLLTYGDSTVSRGASYWKFNNKLLLEKEYVNKINTVIDETVLEYNNTNVNPQMLWEICKIRIKQTSCIFGKQSAHKSRSRYDAIVKQLSRANNCLVTNPNNAILNREVNKLQCELEIYELSKANGAQIRAKVEWVQYGEKNTSYFLGLEKSKAHAKFMDSMKLPDGKVIVVQEDIMNEQVKFFQKLYSKKFNFDTEKLNTFTNNITVPKLNDTERDSCEGLLTLSECTEALKNMKNDSSPGCDGLTAGWFKMFWPKIRNIVNNALNYGIQNGKLSATQRRGIIKLVHKGKGSSKDDLNNWRPISLSTVDYKIAAKVMANRMKQKIKKLVHEDQAGFIKGRNSAEIIRALDDILEYLDVNQLLLTIKRLLIQYQKNI